jgi:hypothetical protein
VCQQYIEQELGVFVMCKKSFATDLADHRKKQQNFGKILSNFFEPLLRTKERGHHYMGGT